MVSSKGLPWPRYSGSPAETLNNGPTQMEDCILMMGMLCNSVDVDDPDDDIDAESA
jgi:hypothetical protein